MRVVAVAILVAVAGTASAGGRQPEPGTDYVLVPPQPYRASGLTHTIYLNRCASGCTLRTDVDDAWVDGSTIPETSGPLAPFGLGDAAWDQVVACVRETYAAFDVEVTTDPPADGTHHIEVMIAGSPGQLGLDANILGIAPLTVDCSPQIDVIAFAFANIHGGDVIDICATAAHEAGHTFGLDHEFECKDPMTYLVNCGQKQFINLEAECGEFDAPRECRCTGQTQDSYKKLIGELGPGVEPAAPGVTIQVPQPGTVIIDGTTLFVQTDEPRIVIRVELWINGWRWSDTTGTVTQSLFMIALPDGVPDGVIDLEVRAVNDVGGVGTAAARVTKGLPCTSAATCAEGQECDGEGRCVYPVPAGQLGDDCTHDLDCESTRCLSDGTNQICASACLTGEMFEHMCPDDFTCLPTEVPTSGACWPEELVPGGGGCCQTGSAPAGSGVLVAVTTIGLLVRRRRRLTR